MSDPECCHMDGRLLKPLLTGSYQSSLSFMIWLCVLSWAQQSLESCVKRMTLPKQFFYRVVVAAPIRAFLLASVPRCKRVRLLGVCRKFAAFAISNLDTPPVRSSAKLRLSVQKTA